MTRRLPPMNHHDTPKENTNGLLKLFVYGTLKRGYWNHDRFCQGVLSVEEADALKGLLEAQRFRMPFGSFRDLLR